MSEICSMCLSNHPAEFFCSCGVLLCNQHLADHIKTDISHTHHTLWNYLSQQEIQNLRDSIHCLDEYLLSKINQLDTRFQKKEEVLTNNIQRSRDNYLRQKEFQIERRENIENLLQSMLRTKQVPLYRPQGTMKRFIKLLEADRFRSPETLVETITGYLMTWPNKYSICIYDLMKVLDENLEETTIDISQIGNNSLMRGIELIDGSILVTYGSEVHLVWPETKTTESLPILT